MDVNVILIFLRTQQRMTFLVVVHGCKKYVMQGNTNGCTVFENLKEREREGGREREKERERRTDGRTEKMSVRRQKGIKGSAERCFSQCYYCIQLKKKKYLI